MTAEPESRRQAQRWEQVKRRYLDVLGCHRCAAQAAWGTQCGFGVVHPPCESCRSEVATFPVPAAKGWRKLSDESVPASLLTANAMPVSPAPGDAEAVPHGRMEGCLIAEKGEARHYAGATETER